MRVLEVFGHRITVISRWFRWHDGVGSFLYSYDNSADLEFFFAIGIGLFSVYYICISNILIPALIANIRGFKYLESTVIHNSIRSHSIYGSKLSSDY